MKTSHSFNRSLFVVLALGCFALLPRAEAVVTDPEGYFPGGNTGEGQNALFGLRNGSYNTAVGFFSLRALTSGNFNTATGAGTLLVNTADQNTATGAGALLSNTTGDLNTANGAFALFSNTEGNLNTANGVNALFKNTTGFQNTAGGANALANNNSGRFNTAHGASALASNTTGSYNTAYGAGALANNTTSDGNTANGFYALFNKTAGGNNIAVGNQAGSNLITGDNNIAIGNVGVAAESNTIRIGTQGTQTATYVAGIFGATITDGAPVLVDTNGHLGTMVSSVRFKDEIKPMDKASESILALKPVTFHYKSNTKGMRQFGLIAEEVAKVNPDLVVRDNDGEIYTVRYDAVNAMLLNEFLKEHRKVKELEAIIAQQQNGLEALTAQLKHQAARIHKVSAQIETDKLATGRIRRREPVPQVALNNH